MGLIRHRRRLGAPYKDKASPVLMLAMTLLLHGCSSESAKRTAFETLQNLHEQQCAQDLSGKCPQRESYDDYQRKRESAEPSE